MGRTNGGSRAAVGLIVLAPIIVTVGLDQEHARTRFPTAIDPFLTDPGEARQAADFINAHAGADELVIVSPAIGWMVRARTADVQMAIAADGVRTVHYPAGIPADRWVYDPHVDGARFVVIDGFWRGWGIANIDGLGAITERVERWPIALDTGSIRVYENPAGRGSGP